MKRETLLKLGLPEAAKNEKTLLTRLNSPFLQQLYPIECYFFPLFHLSYINITPEAFTLSGFYYCLASPPPVGWRNEITEI